MESWHLLAFSHIIAGDPALIGARIHSHEFSTHDLKTAYVTLKLRNGNLVTVFGGTVSHDDWVVNLGLSYGKLARKQVARHTMLLQQYPGAI